jgi:hypothetical protein
VPVAAFRAEPVVMYADDPRNEVEAPVRHALVRIIVRGLVLVGITLAAVLCPVIPALHTHADGVAIAVVALLYLYALVVALERRFRTPIEQPVRASAWYKAREIDDGDAMLALVIAGWVPVALAAALIVMIWPHLNDPNPQLRGAWAVIAVPQAVAAWLFATTAWLDSCRDELARAIGESERRFRSYWANVGH